MFRYAVIRITSGLLRIGGFVGVILSVIALMSAYQWLGPSQVTGADSIFVRSFGLFALYGGLSLLVSSLLMIAAGQMLQVFVDIALNTRPIGELVETSRSTARFFEAMTQRNQGSP
jgi:hypothetical protein